MAPTAPERTSLQLTPGNCSEALALTACPLVCGMNTTQCLNISLRLFKSWHEAGVTEGASASFGSSKKLRVMGNDRVTTLPAWEFAMTKKEDGAALIASDRAKWDPKYQRQVGLKAGPATLEEDASQARSGKRNSTSRWGCQTPSIISNSPAIFSRPGGTRRLERRSGSKDICQAGYTLKLGT